jgi:predicted DNA-binding protein (MmcQ/YjbR family)
MNAAELRAYLLSKPGAVEQRPLSPEIPVYKVMGKMFAYASPDAAPPRLTVKLEPAHGRSIRSMHSAVQPGYHMHKEHWNTVLLDGSVPDERIKNWIDASYELVVERLPKTSRDQLKDLA